MLSVGGILNLAIVWDLIKIKKLFNVDMAISLQISLLTLVLVLLPALVNIAAGEWVFGAYGCSWMGFVEYLLRNSRMYLMVAYTLDQSELF